MLNFLRLQDLQRAISVVPQDQVVQHLHSENVRYGRVDASNEAVEAPGIPIWETSSRNYPRGKIPWW